MSTNLYQVLGVPKDATPEQIRKAYRKQALKTHPDKLPPGLGEEEKAAFAEKFKEISHACEILADPERRKEYDVHGVWPPPEPTSDEDSDPFFDHMQGHASHGFSSPFFTSHSHQFRSTNFFRDPLELFDSIFRDFDDLFMTEAVPSTQTFTPFSPLGSLGSQRPRGMFNFDDPFFGPTPGLLSTVPIFPPMLTSSFAQGSGREHGRGYQVRTESYVSHTVNGVSQSTHTRRDGDGNEHVRRKMPNGREVYTINGVEQPARGSIQQANHEPRRSSCTQPRHRNTLPYFQPQPTHRHQRNLSPRSQTHPDIHSVSTEGYHNSPPSYPGNNSSRTYARGTNRNASNIRGFTQYGERRYPRAPDHV